MEIAPYTLKDYPELPQCLAYLIMREQGVPIPEIVERIHTEFNTTWRTRAHLYNKISAWRRNGTYAEAERIFLEPKIADINAAIQRVINYWPDMVEKVAQIVLKGKSDKNRLEAFIYLHEQIVRPALEARAVPSTHVEIGYLEGRAESGPLESLDKYLEVWREREAHPEAEDED